MITKKMIVYGYLKSWAKKIQVSTPLNDEAQAALLAIKETLALKTQFICLEGDSQLIHKAISE